MLFNFIDYKSLLIIGHVFGVIVGMGSALISDFMFFSSVRDGEVSDTEVRFLNLGSKLVWAGLTIAVIFGALLFYTNPIFYLHSDKFIAKMTIVGVLIVNGLSFKFLHMPSLIKTNGRITTGILVSGAISTISWLSAFILGSFHSIPYDFFLIMTVYALANALGAGVAIVGNRFIFPNQP